MTWLASAVFIFTFNEEEIISHLANICLSRISWVTSYDGVARIKESQKEINHLPCNQHYWYSYFGLRVQELQAAQRGCGFSILGDVQNPKAHSSGQLAPGDPALSRAGLDYFVILILFEDHCSYFWNQWSKAYEQNKTCPKALPFCILKASLKTKPKLPSQPPWPHIQFWKGSISVSDSERVKWCGEHTVVQSCRRYGISFMQWLLLRMETRQGYGRKLRNNSRICISDTQWPILFTQIFR